ncbi:hypothetical protein [Hydrogenophaga sp.]|uniref:hypothetical protein n=1 Tax=Hydrogenophaga sp. TaxID=1904254 RepID=UPI00391D7FFB
MSTDLAEDVCVAPQPPLATPQDDARGFSQWSPAMSHPDHLLRITQQLSLPAGVAVRLRHLIEDVIVR